VNAVVRPALAGAEHSFSTALRQITVADMVKRAPQPV
jgi:DNA-binding IscR family transcriptional regulator